jgi:predicted permease
MRQFVTEGLLLVATGSAAGAALAAAALHAAEDLVPADMLARMPYLAGMRMSGHVLLFTAGIVVLAGIVFGVAPVLRMPKSVSNESLNDGGRTAAGTGWRRFGSKLVVVELATAVVLLVSAGLLGKSFYRLLHVETGMRAEHLATAMIYLPRAQYAKDEQIYLLKKKLLERVERLPGVKSAGVVSDLPVGSGDGMTVAKVVGKPELHKNDEVVARFANPGYFRTLGARLREGRYFTEEEDRTKLPVVVINQTMARLYFAGEEAIGQQITVWNKPPTRVVGVIEDIREGPLEMEVRPAFYLPFSAGQDPSFGLVVRAEEENGLLPALSAAAHEIDPGVAVYAESTMSEKVRDSPSATIHRGSAWLIGGFAATALLLGIIGLYGVIAYSVSQRTREIGVRMALGAGRSRVMKMVMREAGWLTAVGIAAGLVCSLVAATMMRGLLFGVSAWDGSTLIAVAVVLGCAALAASAIPARRAASVDPMEALRAE